MTDWTKSSWRDKPRIQMPDYPDQDALHAVEAELSRYPLLVFAGEARRLKKHLAAAGRGEAFLLQGGDCAESFEQFSSDMIRDTFKVMLQMAIVLTHGAKVPVIKLGRMAGQFAKPRSAPTEVIDGVELPSYRGDIINELAFTPEARIPDPKKMLRAYTQAAATLNLIRAFSTGGYADVHQVHGWTLGFTESEKAEKYREIANRISDTLDFMAAAGVTSETAHTLQSVEYYTSHESLLLEYEEALCRQDSQTGKWLAGSGHMIWIGDRTRQPDGAHVEFARGVQNPIGLKCGPTMTSDDLKQLMKTLNPQNEEGRLTLITLRSNETSPTEPPVSPPSPGIEGVPKALPPSPAAARASSSRSAVISSAVPCRMRMRSPPEKAEKKQYSQPTTGFTAVISPRRSCAPIASTAASSPSKTSTAGRCTSRNRSLPTTAASTSTS